MHVLSYKLGGLTQQIAIYCIKLENIFAEKTRFLQHLIESYSRRRELSSMQ